MSDYDRILPRGPPKTIAGIEAAVRDLREIRVSVATAHPERVDRGSPLEEARSSRAVFLPGTPDAVFGVYHPGRGLVVGTAVLLLPPFGWEDMCSYRGRRDWAVDLAAAGHPVLRIDLPGTGDSGGSPGDPDRVQAWSEAVSASAAWLRRTSGSPRLAAVGIGLGGLIAHHATAHGAPVDDLALWAVPARGRTLVRELRMFAGIEASELLDAGVAQGAQPADGSLSAAGYLMTAETIADLEQLDLTALPLPNPGGRRVLLLDRDGRSADRRLRDAYHDSGVELTVAPGPGYAEMLMIEPQEARPSLPVLKRIGAWLKDAQEADAVVGPASAERVCAPESGDGASVEMVVDGRLIRETALSVEHPFGSMRGVLSQPVGEAAALGVLWLNAGPQRRTGPNRMWVEASRRWAARGVASLRVDLAGIGDADGDDSEYRDPRIFYLAGYLEQAHLALDVLQQRGHVSRAAVGGLCVGGYWSLQLLLDDPRATAGLMLNPGTFIYDGGYDRSKREVRVLLGKALQRSTWLRILRGRTSFSVHFSTLGQVLHGALRAAIRLPSRVRSRREPPVDRVGAAFDELRERDRRALIVFAGQEPLHAELERDGHVRRLERWPNLHLEHVDLPLQTHTLRPLWLQQQVHATIDHALERELALTGEAALSS